MLTAYQNLDMLEKNPSYKGLFVPFKDKTNGKISYGGGRYLDIEIPINEQLILDFNEAYNPIAPTVADGHALFLLTKII